MRKRLEEYLDGLIKVKEPSKVRMLMEQIELNMVPRSWKISHLGWLTAVWTVLHPGHYVNTGNFI